MVLCVAANGYSSVSAAETAGSRPHVQVCLCYDVDLSIFFKRKPPPRVVQGPPVNVGLQHLRFTS